MSDPTDPVPYPQRNAHPYAVDVPAIPATVQPGEVVTWPFPNAGFEPVTDAAAPAADPAPAAPKKKASAAAPTGEEPTP